MLSSPRSAIAFAACVLAGCASAPANHALSEKARDVMQPMQVEIGIGQSELYAGYLPANSGVSSATVCGSIPGIGILLAAVCGATAGAVDSSINASRAKTAQQTVQPLKNAIVDLRFDRDMDAAVTAALATLPDTTVSNVEVTKAANMKSYEQIFRDSTAGSIMYMNVEYRLSPNFRVLEIAARTLVFPRSPEARRATGKSFDRSPSGSQAPLLGASNAVYQSNIVFQASLPEVNTATPAGNIAGWKAHNAAPLRGSIAAGIVKVSRLVADDLSGKLDFAGASTMKVDNVNAKVISQTDGQLVRYPDNTIYFRTGASAAVANVQAPTTVSSAAVAVTPTGAP